MRVLSLWQPWASFIALNYKQNETRSWGTEYRGKLLIHAAKRPIDEIGKAAIWDVRNRGASIPATLPLGAVVAVVDLTACKWIESEYSPVAETLHAYINEQSSLELAVGDWSPGRYAWKLENIIALPEPIAWKGAQGLRIAPPELMELVNKQLLEVV